MEKYLDFWQRNSIWEKIFAQKPIFIEPRAKKELKQTIREYNASINQGKGAIFMAVCIDLSFISINLLSIMK